MKHTILKDMYWGRTVLGNNIDQIVMSEGGAAC